MSSLDLKAKARTPTEHGGPAMLVDMRGRRTLVQRMFEEQTKEIPFLARFHYLSSAWTWLAATG